MTGRDNDFTFLDPGDLTDGVIRLELTETCAGDLEGDRPPSYAFHVCSLREGQKVGGIRLRIGTNAYIKLYAGQVGYNISEAYRGRRFAARAVQLITQLAKRHGMSELWITCDPENIPSRRTCELAGAEFIEIVDLPPEIDVYAEGERRKCRYRLRL